MADATQGHCKRKFYPGRGVKPARGGAFGVVDGPEAAGRRPGHPAKLLA